MGVNKNLQEYMKDPTYISAEMDFSADEKTAILATTDATYINSLSAADKAVLKTSLQSLRGTVIADTAKIQLKRASVADTVKILDAEKSGIDYSSLLQTVARVLPLGSISQYTTLYSVVTGLNKSLGGASSAKNELEYRKVQANAMSDRLSMTQKTNEKLLSDVDKTLAMM